MRVLLTEQKTLGIHSWVISSSDGFIIDGRKPSAGKVNVPAKTVNICARDGSFYLNGKRFARKQICISSRKGLLRFGDNAYKGLFLLVFDRNGVAQLINRVDMEDYVFAVLRSESWPGWPLEVNKVFAVATRTYVLSKIRESQKTKQLYHIKNTKVHQTYCGHDFMVRNSRVLQQAVDETKGLLLVHDGKPIVAMFDSCCGGIIPANMEGVDFDKAPYLARLYPCKHCKRCRLYRWETEYDIDQWTCFLRKAFPKLQRMCGIKITRRDGAGVIQEVEVVDKKRSFTMSGKKMYSLLDDVKSYHFSICKKGKNIQLKGRGFGHHIGLCQWGAREMVRDGWDYRKILSFYYPGVTFAHCA